MRESSSAKPTREKANTPHKFFFISQPETNFIVVPRVSSENRRYVLIGFLPPDIIASDALSIIPNAEKYHFGVLTSNIHMAWMRTVAGRLKSDYRYSGSIVYNNFPWVDIDDNMKNKITKTAQAILDARALYPESSLANMYGDKQYLYPELLRAHQENDKAVMEAYGLIKLVDGKRTWLSESETVTELFNLYEKISKK
nr:type IIL restriction-modification enzyme MmeI [Streptococcus uberis]